MRGAVLGACAAARTARWRRSVGVGHVRLWSTASGELLVPPLLHWDWVTALAFSPDGTKLLTGSGDYTARLWSATNGYPIGAVMRHEEVIMDVSFSPDGRDPRPPAATGPPAYGRPRTASRSGCR